MREVRDADGQLYHRTVEPYHSSVGGIVVTYKPANETGSHIDRANTGNAQGGMETETSDVIRSLVLGTTQVGVWTLEVNDSRFDWDGRFEEITGLNQTGLSLEGSGFADGMFSDDRAEFQRGMQALIQDGEALDQELRFSQPGQRARWLRIRAQRTENSAGDLIVGILSDITERKSETERSNFMMRELDHRVKNLLAIILSIAEISARSNDDIETFKNDFRARLESMARTHNLLAQTQWSGSDLRSLVEEEVYSLIPKDAATIDGAPVEISPTATQSLAMFFHELTVNALKHGALSADSGKIAISWEIDGSSGERLRLQWSESGRGDVTTPSKQGFGGKVINRIVKRQLDAEVTTDWDAAGMELTAHIPLRNIAASSSIKNMKA